MIKLSFRKPFEFLQYGDNSSFALVTVMRVVTQGRVREIEGTDLTGNIRVTEQRMTYGIAIDLWFFVIRITFHIWQANKQ